MATEIRTVDGSTVLFQYGLPVPSFETWSGNAPPRDHRSLSGLWRFRFDPSNRGVDEEWYAPEFDATDWREVDVPLPWDLYDTPGFASYDGADYGTGTAFRDGYAWYRTRFTPDASWDERTVRVNFLGVHYEAWVYLDGTLVGRHEGGHTPFALDVSDALVPGEENVLAVRVFRRPWWESYTASDPRPVASATAVPAAPVDYWPYAGITRDVYLEAVPDVTVYKLLVDARDGTVTVEAVLRNHGDDRVTRRLTVDPGEGTGGSSQSTTVALDPGAVRVATLSSPIPDAAPWTPSSPTTYRAVAVLSGGDGSDSGGDALSTEYGMRTVGTDGSRLTVNGEPTFLKGLNWHEETPSRGRSLSRAAYDDVLDRVDDLRANFLRNSHYNRHPYLYEAADDAGVVVMDEVENVWLDGHHQRVQLGTYGLSRALVAAMVWNQHNHPSVGLWSLHNECDSTGSVYRSWLADMREAAVALDRQRRPVTWASYDATDPAFDLADVVAFNEYFGYFTGRTADLGPTLDRLHETYPETPLLITENGAWSTPALRSTSARSPTIEGTPAWQAAMLRANWRQVTEDSRIPFVAGYTYWNLCDYKERDDYNRFSFNGISTMGLLSFVDDSETVAYETFRQAENPRSR